MKRVLSDALFSYKGRADVTPDDRPGHRHINARSLF